MVGGGGHARVLIHALMRLGHDIEGYTALNDEGRGMQVPYLGTDDILGTSGRRLPSCAALGVGKTGVQCSRLDLLDKLQALGFRVPVIHAPGAICHSDVRSGAGTVVLDGAVVVTGSRLGHACIVNTNATVDHDCVLGDDVHIAPGATLSGGVEIGDRCMIGIGANLCHAVRVCADCMIGAGATVIRDITVSGVYVGTPARRIA
ncbi:NeuD/PglB/VioB family sugar acetyltransferase [Halomonas kalidii]|uniref:NeuD/PglB/VioB family sugar acetyltransferase n=1 Tax=Halomonas kalidii TaxID=3043293 RepID=A0ABT6VKE0_9GAMM|nr:NeuD/PglB/VioB family sugar acetyltransferase [Halomonas kalidii]MDI5934150.1 NeuD/PglB/VioB family sugar acetyltransferase [Halomonas kalidii]